MRRRGTVVAALREFCSHGGWIILLCVLVVVGCIVGLVVVQLTAPKCIRKGECRREIVSQMCTSYVNGACIMYTPIYGERCECLEYEGERGEGGAP